MSPRRSPRIAALAQAQHNGPASSAAPQRVTPSSQRDREPNGRGNAGAAPSVSQGTPTPQPSSRAQTEASSARAHSGQEGPRGSSTGASSSAPVPQVPLPRSRGTETRDGPAEDRQVRTTGQTAEGLDLFSSPVVADPPANQVFTTPMTSIPSVFQFPDHQEVEETTSAISAMSVELASLNRGGKPSKKNITAELFSGFVPPGEFDSGVRRWWRKFTDQLVDAQILDGHRWGDIQCRSIFASSLRGDAADWYSEVRMTHSDLTLEKAGAMLVAKFKSKLPEQELMSRIMAEPKRRQESYQEYAQRRLNMADSLPGGLAVEANARQAVHTFIKRAYYKYTDELKSFVERIGSRVPAASKLQLLVDHLAYMADSDGRLQQKLPRDPEHISGFKRVKIEGAPSNRTTGRAMAAIFEHKRKKPHATRKQPPEAGPTTRCFNCKQLGHFARDCPDKTGKDLTSVRLQGSAAAALEEDSA